MANSSGPIAEGEVWMKKMQTLYRRLDTTGKGYLMVDDILDIAAAVFTTYPKMQGYKNNNIVKAIITLWYEVLCHHLPSQAAATTFVLRDGIFVANIQKAMKGDFQKTFDEKFVNLLFTSMDQDDDGMITHAEFASLMSAFRSVERDSDLLFKLRSGGAKMSHDQFLGLFTEFFFTNDPKSKVNRLWGPLVEYKRAGDYGTLDCGPTWEGKMRTMYRRLDVTQSSKLRCDDLLQIGHALITRNHLDKRKATVVLHAMINIWVKFFSTDKTGARLEEIREIDFIHNLRDTVNGDFRHEIDQFGLTFFTALDVDHTGFITQTAFRNLQEAWNVGRDEAEGMFKVIDTNHDGKISSDEFMHAWNDYFLSEDPHSPFRIFFGPAIYRQTEAK